MFNLITVSIFISLFVVTLYFVIKIIKKSNLTCSVDDQSVSTGVNCEVYYIELTKIAMDRAEAEENSDNMGEYMRTLKLCDERLIAVSKRIRAANKSHLRIAS
ncbi:hypothetical protein Sps_05152 [Shewanella psychrophila]|uniref:Uncharacterized protein n=1 Tax=Shewanella psychrophila TaxID=225848 RepID=A0A1S6HXJ4_9GAMM|nr:hypothetical protein [Shewanella psychrophila]AQS40221.1 hypothetical protein Sps_05152 [Shewanella psychrophila]